MQECKHNVVLVGPMGTGKTTIGKMLAKEMHFEFKDSDREIEERSGADIPWIFDVEGEVGFRARERAVIEELSQVPDIIVATGGGAVASPENQHFLKCHGFVVYLHTSIEQQYLRTRKDRKRPLLQSKDPKTVLQNLMAVREPIYRSLADYVISTDQKRPKAVVREIIKAVHECASWIRHSQKVD